MSLFDSASLVVTPNGYKEDKLYSIKPTDGSGDLVVTRATTATRVNSAGLVEQVPYNLLTYSQDFDNADWSKNNCTVTANSTTAPNGTTTADLIVSTSTTETGVYKIPSVEGQNVWSVYAKKGTGRYLVMNTNAPLIAAKFDLETGQIVGTPSTGANASIESVGNGWYRCIISSSTSTNRFTLFITNNTTTTDFTSSVGLSVYLWGAQLVSGTSAKEYFPTTDRLDVPRLDYTNSTCPSILVEPQRTNLLTYSEDFSSTRGWNPSNAGGSTTTYTANYGIAPDGTNSADRIQLALNGGPYADWLLFSPTLTIGQTYTYSIYIKSLTTNCNIIFLGAVTGGNISKNITTEWVRYDYTFVANNAFCVPRFLIEGGTSASADILICGMQLEAGSYATSYVPTQASSVTRNADVISKTGISSLIGQTEGTMFVDFVFTDYDVQGILPISLDNDASNITYFYIDSNGRIYCDFIVGGTIQSSISTATSFATKNTRYKMAIAYKANDFAFYINGNLIGTDTSGSVVQFSKLALNYSYASGYLGSKKINSAQIYKTRLSNTELAQLTTI